MAITFTNARQLSTPSNGIWVSSTAASLAFRFRYEVAGSSAQSVVNNTRVVSKPNDYGIAMILTNPGSEADQVEPVFQIRNAATQIGRATPALSVGATYHVAVTYAAGAQRLYLNGVLHSTFSFLSGALPPGNAAFRIGGTPGGTPCVFTLSDVATWDGYALSVADAVALRDGDLTPAGVGAGASLRGWWTLAGATGTTVSPGTGQPGLASQFGGAGMEFTTATGAGTAVYGPQLIFEPAAEVAEAKVCSSGRVVAVTFRGISSGAIVKPTTIVTAPSIAVNGADLGALTHPWLTGKHTVAVWRIPGTTRVVRGDVVTLDAGKGWAVTTAGVAAAESDRPLTNRAGRSNFGHESTPKTLKFGMNFAHLGTTNQTTYQLPKNWVLRATRFPAAAAVTDALGKPVTLVGTSADTSISDCVTANPVDATWYPCTAGLYAIGWDDLDPASPTTWSIFSTEPAACKVTQRADLANPGDASGVGKVRVYDIQHAAGATIARMKFNINVNHAGKAPKFDNLVVYGPGDFSYSDGVPTVLDRSDMFALSSVFHDRLPDGLGVMRFVDSTIDYGGWGWYSEPEDFPTMDMFSWGHGIYNHQRTIRYTQARPFTSGYVYSSEAGTPYAATLGAAMDATQTTFTVSDAATAPLMAGLVVAIGSEVIRVTDVTGTTVTGVRGSLGTTAAAHAAGPIQVRGRMAATMGQVGRPNGQVAELVTQAPHKLKTGNVIFFQANLPQFTYTNGQKYTYTTANHSVVFVTGPNSYAICELAASGGTSVTLSAAVTLTPGTHATYYRQPEAAGYPYEFIAKVTGDVPGAELHVNISHPASDSLVDSVAARVRDNFPAGRTVWLEYSNEPWNFPFYHWGYMDGMNRLVHPGAHPMRYYATRAGQVAARVRAVFAQQGRGAEVKLVLNMQAANPGYASVMLQMCRDDGIPVGGIATACYIDSDDDQATKDASTNYKHDEYGDLWIHYVCNYADSSSTNYGRLFDQIRGYVDDHNEITGDGAVLYGYEGNAQWIYLPHNSASRDAKLVDTIYDPYWYHVFTDFLAFIQAHGFHRYSLYCYSAHYTSHCAWGLYHWPGQPYGYGDGSDGKADNRLTLAQQGLPNSKSATTNIDQANVSVVGQAMRDWLAAVEGGGAGDVAAPTVTARSPTPGATDVSINAAVTATFGEAVQPGTIAFVLRRGGMPVSGSVAYNAATRTASLSPSAPLLDSTAYMATLSGAADAAGNVMAAVSWSFTTAAAGPATPPRWVPPRRWRGR